MSSSWRSPITLSPGFTSGNYDTNLETAGLGMLEIGARQLIDWRLHEAPRLPSLLSARCPVQHAYIISCCHVITSDYLGGTIIIIIIILFIIIIIIILIIIILIFIIIIIIFIIIIVLAG